MSSMFDASGVDVPDWHNSYARGHGHREQEHQLNSKKSSSNKTKKVTARLLKRHIEKRGVGNTKYYNEDQKYTGKYYVEADSRHDHVIKKHSRKRQVAEFDSRIYDQ